MKTQKFNYHLPLELIAQKPIRPRDHSRLMVLNRKTGQIIDDYFFNIGSYLKKGDTMVLNDSKVFPARLIGKKETGGRAEILLVHKENKNIWRCLLKTRNAKENIKIKISEKLEARLIKKKPNGNWLVSFNKSGQNFEKIINLLGQAPTPPYIKRISNLKEYQTIYARHNGSIAAPTAGFHFTPELIKKLKKQGIKFEFITLHVGLGTFLPIKTERIEKHQMLEEQYFIKPEVFRRLQTAKRKGAKIISVGTTSTRTLESIFLGKKLKRKNGWTNLFIKPGYHFKAINGLVTNFHLPQSTNLVLISTFAGEKLARLAYQKAVEKKYRFYSFGDATLII
jgi:S-adenosylmethionine:tRNA ribosyltransferase-isomerase